MIAKLRAMEDAYMELFCKKESYGFMDYFHNDFAQGLYAHNFFLMKELTGEPDLKTFISDKLDNVKNQAQSFLKIVFHPQIELGPELLDWAIQTGFEVSQIIYMLKPLDPDLKWVDSPNCVVRRAQTRVEIQNGLDCAAEFSGPRMSAELLRQKLGQKERLYLNQSIQFYVGYVDGVPIGYCDWFQKDGMVKVEEFVILAEHRRKGFGAAMLGKMIADAGQQGFDLIYLVTDEADEAKNLYYKTGFELVGKETELFYKV